jgi:hypothetical protein
MDLFLVSVIIAATLEIMEKPWAISKEENGVPHL